MRVDLLPDEVREELSGLERDAPSRPFAQIRRQIESDLGARGARLAHIDPEPLGTASIAQVHRARLEDGSEVALKVRHPELTPQRVEADVRSLSRWLRLAARTLGARDPAPLLQELREALLDEIDFAREARVADEIRRDLGDTPRVRVPRVIPDLCGASVLALEYVPALPVDDPERLRQSGIESADVAREAVDAYGRQVFGHGSFHADPHAGNVFVVDPASAPTAPVPQILFVDFGLSRRLEPELRTALRKGLHALLKRDVSGIVRELVAIGAVREGRAPDAARALESALAAGADEALAADAAGIANLVELGKRLVRESGAFEVPRGLLLYARTLAHVLELSRRIDPERDPMRVLLPHVLRFLAS